MRKIIYSILIAAGPIFYNCKDLPKQKAPSTKKLSVIFDTDANNEIDDQHALAYLLFSGNKFRVEGITVNATYNGGNIDKHYAEAERVVKLCNLYKKIPIFKGADGNFETIDNQLDSLKFDGYMAVNYMIRQAKKHVHNK